MTMDREGKQNRLTDFILGGIVPIERSKVAADMVAGITLATLAIPEVMGYTKIAGMPVITGLYTILIPMAIYALFGSSRHLVVGADSATAAIMASGLAGMAATASPQYVAYAGILALLAAMMLILARIIRLGFVADFLSRTVLIGFLTGVGIQVAISQLSGMLGLKGSGLNPVQQIMSDIKQIGNINLYTLGVSLGVLLLIVIFKKVDRKIPGALIAVVGAIGLSYLTGLSTHGVEVIGNVPRGLPKFGLPANLTLDLRTIGPLLPIAFSMFIVILAQSAATSRAYALRYDEKFRESVDILGLGLANIGAGLSGTFVVNGSPTKTQMVDSAGGRSQLASLTTAIIVFLVLLFLTRPLAYMPAAALSAVVFMIGVELVDIRGMRDIFVQRPAEFWVALITALVVILIGVEQGIFLAILLSILIHTRHGYKPKNAVLAIESGGKPRMVPISSHAQALPGLVIYRFHHSMYYANAEQFSEEVDSLVNHAEPPIRWFCIDATAMDDIDYSAAAVLRETYTILNKKGIRLVFAQIDDAIYNELKRSRIVELVGAGGFFDSINDVQEAYQKEREK
jgi:SulP family sulfate permease